MPQNPLIDLPEVFLADKSIEDHVHRAVKVGRIRRLRRGLYTSNLLDPIEVIVRRNTWRIVSLLCPGAVVSHRTAFEAKPGHEGLVIVTGPYSRTINDLPGLKIRQMKGPGPLPGDGPFVGLTISSEPRHLLECLMGRSRGPESPFLPQAEIEHRLDRLIRQGPGKVNEIRDSIKLIAPALGAEKQAALLDGIIGALLGTKSSRLLSRAGIQRAAGYPYDPIRVELFAKLIAELTSLEAESHLLPDEQWAFDHAAFFDAYFSNFIEGTEFLIDEAVSIVFEGTIPAARPADAHDILGSYRLLRDKREMMSPLTQASPDDLLTRLMSWHKRAMEQRPEVGPGAFKTKPNKAGSTTFVLPELVQGTLLEGFSLRGGLRSAFAKAAYMMFLVAEVHPFTDGNGRLARAAMNAELLARGEQRIIIPTVFRLEYVGALKRLSRDGEAAPFLRMLAAAHRFTASIDFGSIPDAIRQLNSWNAFSSDTESRLRNPAI